MATAGTTQLVIQRAIFAVFVGYVDVILRHHLRFLP